MALRKTKHMTLNFGLLHVTKLVRLGAGVSLAHLMSVVYCVTFRRKKVNWTGEKKPNETRVLQANYGRFSLIKGDLIEIQ